MYALTLICLCVMSLPPHLATLTMSLFHSSSEFYSDVLYLVSFCLSCLGFCPFSCICVVRFVIKYEKKIAHYGYIIFLAPLPVIWVIFSQLSLNACSLFFLFNSILGFPMYSSLKSTPPGLFPVLRNCTHSLLIVQSLKIVGS